MSKSIMAKFKIPKSFKLFGSTVNIVWDNKYCNNTERYGEFCYGQQKITLSTVDGLTNLSPERIEETFYHEKIHAILDAMHERELSRNEKFVDTFAKLLRQSDQSALYK